MRNVSLIFAFSGLLVGCASASKPSSSDSADVAEDTFKDCQLVQRDLTKPRSHGGYWCKDSHFISRDAMKRVQINESGVLRESLPTKE